VGPLKPVYDQVAVDELQLRINTMEFRTEADVSYKLVVPLLCALGYSERDRDDQPSVQMNEGSKSKSLTPDHIAYNREIDSLSNTPLLVVEAKKKGLLSVEKNIIHAGRQVKSYGDWIRCNRLLVTDAARILIYDRYQCLEAVGDLVPLLDLDCRDLEANFDAIYEQCSKSALTNKRQHAKIKPLE
jgi:hypothetical protein